MELLYKHEHTSCKNYESGENSLVEISRASKGSTIKRKINDTEIAFIVEGRLVFSYQSIDRKTISKGEMILLTPGGEVKIEIEEDVCVVVCRVGSNIQMCKQFTKDDLMDFNDPESDSYFTLRFNERIENFIENFISCYDEGLRCHYYLKTKINELMYLFRGYYSKEDLARFFSPLLSSDANFTSFIWDNYKDVKSVQEFADKANYSLPMFNSKFKKLFGISAGKWLNDKRARNIYHDLSCSEKPFVEICDEYNLATPSSLTSFCRKHFNLTPTGIRNKEKE